MTTAKRHGWGGPDAQRTGTNRAVLHDHGGRGEGLAAADAGTLDGSSISTRRRAAGGIADFFARWAEEGLVTAIEVLVLLLLAASVVKKARPVWISAER